MNRIFSTLSLVFLLGFGPVLAQQLPDLVAAQGYAAVPDVGVERGEVEGLPGDETDPAQAGEDRPIHLVRGILHQEPCEELEVLFRGHPLDLNERRRPHVEVRVHGACRGRRGGLSEATEGHQAVAVLDGVHSLVVIRAVRLRPADDPADIRG